jgi:phospholipase/carboxylesterase
LIHTFVEPIMNRLPSPSSTKKIRKAHAPHRSPSRQLPLLDHGSQHYKLLAPMHYEPNYAYPLVVWLHGPGDDEGQLKRIMPHVSLRNYVSVAPRGVEHEETGCTYNWSQQLRTVDAAAQAVHDCVDRAKNRFNINAERVFLAGLQSGGTMALRLALAEPGRFAGAISLGGPFPTRCGALGRLYGARELPMLILRGMESAEYSEEQMCEEIRLFHSACLNVHYRVYRCGDEVMTDQLRDIDAWLMERVTGSSILQEQDSVVE